jgi:MFS family permease
MLPSRRSHLGLNAANFFLGQVVAVVLPFLDTVLRARGWGYGAIGLATSIVGIGVFLTQAPAGLVLDRIGRPRAIVALASLGVGAGYAAVPLLASSHLATDGSLVVAGVAQAFLAPGLAGLAVDLAGPKDVGRVLAPNRIANHLGHIVAAAGAMIVAPRLGDASIFAGVLAASVLAALFCVVIRRDELVRRAVATSRAAPSPWPPRARTGLLADRRATVLIGTTGLFHLASAPAIPLAALYLDALSASGRKVAAMVLVAQLAMIPATVVAGRYCDRIGRRPLFLVAFVAVPLRSAICAVATSPDAIVAAQLLEGVAAGLEGVALAAMCADVAASSGRFNTLMAIATMPLGAVLGPIGTGILVERFGFHAAFACLAVVGGLGVALFFRFMPETIGADEERAGAGQLAVEP